MKEYIITFPKTVQISPDEWKVVNPSMRVDENTTVKEIDLFYRKHSKEKILELKIIEIESL